MVNVKNGKYKEKHVVEMCFRFGWWAEVPHDLA